MYHIVVDSFDCVRKWDFRGRTWINRRKIGDRDKRNRDTRNEFLRSIFATKFLAPLSDNRKFVRTNIRFKFFTVTLSNACANKKIKDKLDRLKFLELPDRFEMNIKGDGSRIIEYHWAHFYREYILEKLNKQFYKRLNDTFNPLTSLSGDTLSFIRCFG